MDRLKAEVSPSDQAILYLTSGATGEPKMALVTHAAVVANLDMGKMAFPLGPNDATVAFLPSAHIAQRIVVELLPMRLGTPVNFAESLLKLPAGNSGCPAHYAAGSAAHVGAHLLHYLYRAAQASGRGPQSVLWRFGHGACRRELQASGQTRSRAHPDSLEGGRQAFLRKGARAARRTSYAGMFRRGAL